MTETPPTSSGDELPATAWVTVAEAAEKSGVGTSTIRQWYRSGRLPTQRAEIDRGAFLVPLDAVLALAHHADEEGDALVAEVIDLNASYWSSQTEAAREEATAAKNDLAQARSELQAARDEVQAAHDQLELLRDQLAETAEEARQLRDQVAAGVADHDEDRTGSPDDASAGDEALRAQLEDVQRELADVRDELDETRGALDRATDELGQANAELERTARDLERTEGQLEVVQRQLKGAEAELTKLKEISSAFGSITDNSWVDLPTNSYRSPVRPQGMAAAAGDALSGLLAATQPDPVAGESGDERAAAATDDPWAAQPELEPVQLAHDPDAPDEAVAPPVRPHHRLGHHDDDLLPQPEKKGRRGRR